MQSYGLCSQLLLTQHNDFFQPNDWATHLANISVHCHLLTNGFLLQAGL